MARSLSSNMLTAFGGSVIKPVMFVKAELDDETVRLWNGIGDITWDGSSWLGAGAILTLGQIDESAGLKATGTSLTISGIPSEYVSLALQEDYQGRMVTIYVGALDENNDVIADPAVVFKGRIDVMSISDGADSATVALSIENRLIDFERPRVRRYTDQDQKIDYPNDRGFESVNAIQEMEIKWGRS